MRELLLMRHAEAAARAIGGTDFDRPLTDSGRAAADRAGQRLRERAPRPRLVLYSPASRTSQTAELVGARLGLEPARLHAEPRIYLATSTALARVIAELGSDHSCLLLIAHNPAISELAHALQPAPAHSMATAEWRHIPLAIDNWSALAP
jgi:phosphohistidine phosphatase